MFESGPRGLKGDPPLITAILVLSLAAGTSIGTRPAGAVPLIVTFGTSSAAWGASGLAQGIFVQVENVPYQPLQLTIYAAMKSGSSTYVLEGGTALGAGQNGTVFLQDFLTTVPVGNYQVTFSAITTANQAVSAPTTPVSITS